MLSPKQKDIIANKHVLHTLCTNDNIVSSNDISAMLSAELKELIDQYDTAVRARMDVSAVLSAEQEKEIIDQYILTQNKIRDLFKLLWLIQPCAEQKKEIIDQHKSTQNKIGDLFKLLWLNQPCKDLPISNPLQQMLVWYRKQNK